MYKYVTAFLGEFSARHFEKLKVNFSGVFKL